MKTFFQSLKNMAKTVATVVGIAIGLAVATVPTQSHAQTSGANVGLATRWGYFSNATFGASSPLTVATSATSTINSTNVAVYRGRGLALFASFAGTNSGTANVTFNFDVTYNKGTNYSTTAPIAWVVPMNGTTGVLAYTNILADRLDNVSGIRLTSIANAHTASVFVTNVVWSVFP